MAKERWWSKDKWQLEIAMLGPRLFVKGIGTMGLSRINSTGSCGHLTGKTTQLIISDEKQFHLGHSTPWPHFNKRAQSSLVHLLRLSTSKSRSPRRSPQSSNFPRQSQNTYSYDDIWSCAHLESYPGPNHKSPQRVP